MDILDELDVEAIHQRYKGTQIDALCRSHEELRKRLEELLKGKDDENE